MEPEYIKLSEYARIYSLHYRTIVRHFKQGRIEGFTDKNGRMYAKNPRLKNETPKTELDNKVILYARVSSTNNKPSLDGQINRMRDYAAAKGWNIIAEYKEIASGLNDNRKKLTAIFERDDYDILLVEHKDRLSRFGFNYIKKILDLKHCRIVIINDTNDKDQEIVDDFISIITSFCGKIYGSKRKEKTQKIIEEVKANEEKECKL